LARRLMRKVKKWLRRVLRSTWGEGRAVWRVGREERRRGAYCIRIALLRLAKISPTMSFSALGAAAGAAACFA